MNSDITQIQSSPQNEQDIVPSKLNFPIVGIGASAGGIAALARFFENLPAANDMAFVVVLHLSPRHESAADQILRRVTSMPVQMVTGKTPIKKEHVYIISPNRRLLVSDGCLDVAELERPVGRHTAIDVFFRTLAAAHRERAVAVVLSGTGSDGAVGIATVKEQGGVTIAQSPADAEHSGMPEAAINTGVLDFVLPATDIPRKLLDLWSNAQRIKLPPLGDGDSTTLTEDPQAAPAAEDALHKIMTRLLIHTGHDFRHYKRATILRRLKRRMQVCRVATLPEYCDVLDESPGEYERLLKDLLIGVTRFFRDPEAYEALERDVIPDLLRSGKGELRAWVAGCATGEEAYSIAILLVDQASQLPKPPDIQVFASDIDANAINGARKGTYPGSIIADVSQARLRQFFTKKADYYQVHKSIRDKVLFVTHNLLSDPPFSRMDLVSCRNLLMYLERSVQQQILEMFHFALKPDGVLFLGSTESADAMSDYFVAVDKKNHIYRPKPMRRTAHFMPTTLPRAVQLPANRHLPEPQAPSYAEIHQQMLMKYGPVSILVDADMNIMHMSEHACGLLRHNAGAPTRNLLALVLPELRLELRTALQRARKQHTDVASHRIAVRRDGDLVDVIIDIHPFHDDTTNADLMVVVMTEHARPVDEPGPQIVDKMVRQMENELLRNREQLQETIEHAATSTEELRTAYEKLQAINEELRSATEELETSKEELQSVNEELITVNYELKVKVDETSKAKDDLNNLIASTDIATIFVDRGMRIKRYTPRTTDIFNIIPTDLGRPLFDLTHKLDYEELASDTALTFETLRQVEREVRSIDGQYYIVRMLPYRTNEDRIDGAVLTFFDVTARRLAEQRVRAGEERMRLVAESTKDYAIITLDVDGRVTSWNIGAQRIFGWTEEEMLGQPADVIFVPEDRAVGAPQEEMQRALDDGRAEDERWHMRKDGTRFYCSGVMSPLLNGGFNGYAKIARDETVRIQQESQREAALSKEQIRRWNAESTNAMKDEFLAILSHELRHPLNMIHINVELLSRLPFIQESPVSRKATAVIRSSVTSQAKIIEDLLDLSRLNTGKLTLTKSIVDLAALVQSIAEVAREDPASEGLTITTEGLEEPLFIVADTVRIEQVILNLLSNALKFTQAGGTITLRLSREEQDCRLDVIDNGAGIEPHLLPYIFEMFSQYGSVTKRTKKGLGIGLALVQQIAELHNGRVSASSAGLDKGSCFSVWLPMAHNARLLQSGTLPPLMNDRIRGMRILIVDDAEDLITAFKSLLEMEGATVFIADRASEGLRILNEEKIDLLISDISMPDMDGYEFIAKIREQNMALPAIAVSGLGREQDVHRCYESGFSAHISKPISLETLMQKITDLMGPS